MTVSIYERLVGIASDNHGYVTTRDASQAGIDPAQLKLLARRGRLERAAHGVYRVLALPRTERDEFALAVAWSTRKGIISHESALVLHEMSDVNPARIHMTIPVETYPRAKGSDLYTLHRTFNIDPAEITEVESIPVTTATRTIRDCIETGSDPFQIRNAIEQGRNRGSIPQKIAGELLSQLRHDDDAK